jgi:excisionase family DNA binding protein
MSGIAAQFLHTGAETAYCDATLPHAAKALSLETWRRFTDLRTRCTKRLDIPRFGAFPPIAADVAPCLPVDDGEAAHYVTDSTQTPTTVVSTLGRSVSIEHAARLLGVSRRTIYNRIRDGRLRTVRTLGGSQRVLVESLRENGFTAPPASMSAAPFPVGPARS